MRTICFLAVLALVPAWSQVVKPTPGALTPVGSAPATPAVTAAVPAGTVGRGSSGVSPLAFRKVESDFDFQLKMADQKNPMNVLGLTRGLYLPGFGVIFTTEVELVQNPIIAMFHPTITAEDKANLHGRKIRNLDLLNKQISSMVATSLKNLTFLGPNDQVVVAVRLFYDAWEDKTGLPDQIVMRADRRGGDIKVDVQ